MCIVCWYNTMTLCTCGRHWYTIYYCGFNPCCRHCKESRWQSCLPYTAELQEVLDTMKVTPDFVQLSLGAAAQAKNEEEVDEDGYVVSGPSEEDLAQMPATAYDRSFCFSVIMLYFAWQTIIKVNKAEEVTHRCEQQHIRG